MTSHESIVNDHELILQQSERVLAEAVTIVSPETPQADPLDVFPAPSERRADDTGLELSADQETLLRQAAAELGFGRTTDKALGAETLADRFVIIEGGQPHKVVAEAKLVIDDELAQPAHIIFAGSQRKITAPAELESAQEQDVTAQTEYEMVRKVAESMPGFTPLAKDVPLPFGYDIHNGYEVSEQVGVNQFVSIGSIGSANIILMRVDREDYTDAEGNAKYRKQPGSADVIKIVSDSLTLVGDTDSTVAFVTSGTYEASRNVDAARVSLQTGRSISTASYGTERLAAVKGGLMPEPAPINQLPGELNKLAQQVALLRRALNQEQE